jgi:DNA-binding response OmpR family regulator
MTDTEEIQRRVLIIDDEPQITKIFGLKLKLAGFEVTLTTSGKEGIELIRKQTPDLVLLDILMPGFSGFDVLNEVRKYSTVPIIVFTAYPEKARIAASLGANDYVIKPADPDLLVEKIKKALLSTRL